jgi:hypothetical protein
MKKSLIVLIVMIIVVWSCSDSEVAADSDISQNNEPEPVVQEEAPQEVPVEPESYIGTKYIVIEDSGNSDLSFKEGQAIYGDLEEARNSDQVYILLTMDLEMGDGRVFPPDTVVRLAQTDTQGVYVAEKVLLRNGQSFNVGFTVKEDFQSTEQRTAIQEESFQETEPETYIGTKFIVTKVTSNGILTFRENQAIFGDYATVTDRVYVLLTMDLVLASGRTFPPGSQLVLERTETKGTFLVSKVMLRNGRSFNVDLTIQEE